MRLTRRSVLKVLGTELLAFGGAPLVRGMALRAPRGPAKTAQQVRPLGYTLTDVAQRAGLKFQHYCGGLFSKKYILETTGSGAAFIDYDNDGWLDIFLVNGSR